MLNLKKFYILAIDRQDKYFVQVVIKVKMLIKMGNK